MKNLLNAENHGTPLTIIEKNNYDDWLNKQTSHCQNWLSNTDFSVNGLSLIPNAEGQLSQALFVVKNAKDQFACGD
jgi:leucyl aminopeptidase